MNLHEILADDSNQSLVCGAVKEAEYHKGTVKTFSASGTGMFSPELIRVARENCLKNATHSLTTGVNLYRGTDSLPLESVLLAGDMRGRTSKDSHARNYYTLLMDNLPSWNAYPKRSESYICSMSKEVANDYGSNVFYILPFDDVKLGVADEADLLYSFGYMCHQLNIYLPMNDFNYMIADWFTFTKMRKTTEDNFESWEDFAPALEALGQKLKILDTNEKFPRNYDSIDEAWLPFLITYKWNLLKMFDMMLDPQKNGFKLKYFSSLSAVDDGEVWFSGKAIAIPADEIEQQSLGHDYAGFLRKVVA